MDVTYSNPSSKKILYIFLGISLIIHFSLSYTYIRDGISFNLSSDEKEESRILMRLQPQKSLEKKQIVETEKSKINKKNDSKFLSEKNNVFDRETKNANTGSFKSAAKGNRKAKANKNQRAQKVSKNEKFKKLKFSDLAFKSSDMPIERQVHKKSRQALQRKGLKTGVAKGAGLGQSNDFLDDMPLGDFTKLNTQEYEFYGFYHRVRQKLEQFWGANIQEQAEMIFKKGRSLASDSNLITGLTISLNSKGEIVDILVKSTSGIKELDEAAVESFNQAGPFPNPPKGMVKSGRAVIEWGFVVNT